MIFHTLTFYPTERVPVCAEVPLRNYLLTHPHGVTTRTSWWPSACHNSTGFRRRINGQSTGESCDSIVRAGHARTQAGQRRRPPSLSSPPLPPHCSS